MPAASRIAPVAARGRASVRAGDLKPAQNRGCAPPAPRDEPFGRRRRDVLLTGALTALGAPPAGRAEVLTPKGYEPPAVDPSGWNMLTAGEDTLGCRYEMEWPSGWCALSDLSSARAVGVDASFKDPLDEASTLAVFVSRVGDEVRSQRDRGSLDTVAASRADSAPRQANIGKRERRTRVGGAGESVATYDIETKVGGGTAGRFGAAVELVGITVYGGKEYLVRATASGASWPAQKKALRRAVESFRILDACG